MQERYRRAAIAATLLCALLTPAVGSVASDERNLHQTQDQLETIRDRIDLHEQQAGTLKEKVETVSVDLVDLEIAINNLNDQMDDVKAKAQGAQLEIDDTETDIGKVEDLALDQATELYKTGPAGTLDVVLSSTSLGDLNDRLLLLEITVDENTGALIKYGRLKVALEDQHDDLSALQEILRNTLADREEYQAELEYRKETLVADVAELRSTLVDERDKAHDKREELDDIRDQILAAQAAASEPAPVAPETTTPAAPAGPPPDTGFSSSSGFIWPINGAVTSPFGYRWGRMHEGIDIDGYTGQPIVASKAGQVISVGDAGDGYGTKVVIDHGGGYTTLYAHMSSIATSTGASVSQGQVVGSVGCTGSCTGDHVHFEIRINASPQDPLSYLP